MRHPAFRESFKINTDGLIRTGNRLAYRKAQTAGIPRNIFFLIFLISGTLFLTKHTEAQPKTQTWYQDPASLPPDLPVTIQHLTARVHFKPEENLVFGQADFTFVPNRQPVDSIVFVTPSFEIMSVKINQHEVPFHQSGNLLVAETRMSGLDQHYGLVPAVSTKDREVVQTENQKRQGDPVISIVYKARPMAGLIYFIGWTPEEQGKRKQIWAHRPHGWLPYTEGRITVDLYVTFDRSYKVFSNGERVGILENSDGTKTWHYAMTRNHPFFSTALVIGDYDFVQSKTARGVPLEFWYYNGMADRVPVTYKYTEKMFDFYEKEMGVNYPYPVYREAPVIDYMYGGMETTTSTVFGDYMLIDPRAWWQRNYVNVNAHELAHQWFGNYVSHFVNRDVWLTESFGTYYAKIFERSIYGEDYYQNIRNDEITAAFEASKINDYPVGGSQGGVQRIYQKGSLVLDMLRDVMGEEGFQKSIRHYLKKFGFGSAETNDFTRCLYEATGKPYNWFIDQWILRGGEPRYKVADSVITDSAGHTMIRLQVWQIQEANELKGLFKMPVTWEVYFKDGSKDSIKVWVEKSYHKFFLPNRENKEIDFVIFDPNRKILKKLTYQRPIDRLLAQATKAKNMIDRYDAWIDLRDVTVEIKARHLINSFYKERFWLIKSEILKQLSDVNTPEVTEVFRRALRDPDANVRKSALQNLKRIPDLLQTSVEVMLVDSSYLNVELALDALCSSFPENTAYYLGQTKEMEGWRGKNIKMRWLAIAISQGEKEHLKELIGYTGPRYEFETRINAFRTLKRLSYKDPVTIANAEIASKHWNNKLSSAAREYLKE